MIDEINTQKTLEKQEEYIELLQDILYIRANNQQPKSPKPKTQSAA